MLDRLVVWFRWRPAYSPGALAAVAAALPEGGELGTEDRKYRDAWRQLRRTPDGFAIRLSRHGNPGDWKSVAPTQALAWIDAVADTPSARRHGAWLDLPTA